MISIIQYLSHINALGLYNFCDVFVLFAGLYISPSTNYYRNHNPRHDVRVSNYQNIHFWLNYSFYSCAEIINIYSDFDLHKIFICSLILFNQMLITKIDLLTPQKMEIKFI